ncbi:flagellar basal-body rod protein FlgF [Telmatospirillum sp. J64-1]|uniref:flagellar basal-body rod protein FlgF n=1 Tax=Telmatospirillum sp. J64-1 TaxID=2502183 RepID=UPI00115F764D|nr:flagellar basal-body rod protein FlgF [Telmatospirillum sp. J64-1]
MDNTGYIALSRQAALWRQLETVANNMANANTPAFKAEQMMFSDYLVKTKTHERPFGQKLAFPRDVGMVRDTREGSMTHTGNALDVAIQGDGYFVIDTPAGMRYTRAGHFRLDETGMMVTTEGHAVMQNGDLPVIFAPNEREITIARDGTVSTENGVIGRLRVVTFENEQDLRKAGAGLYDTLAEPIEKERPDVVQGMVEESNVVAVAEMTNMISILRSYQGIQKMLDNEHERQLKVINSLGRPNQNA